MSTPSTTPATDYRAPPGPLANNKLVATDGWCRYDPVACVAQVGIETVFLAVAYCAMLMLLGNQVPQVVNLAKFMFVFALLSFAARMVSDTMSDKLTIGMIASMSGKILTLVVPKIVAW